MANSLDWKTYVAQAILSDNLLVATLALALGVVAGAFHTPLSLLVGMLLALLVRMFLVNHGLITIILSVLYYLAGFLFGMSLFSCNRGTMPWKIQRYPWTRTKMYKLYTETE